MRAGRLGGEVSAALKARRGAGSATRPRWEQPPATRRRLSARTPPRPAGRQPGGRTQAQTPTQPLVSELHLRVGRDQAVGHRVEDPAEGGEVGVAGQVHEVGTYAGDV